MDSLAYATQFREWTRQMASREISRTFLDDRYASVSDIDYTTGTVYVNFVEAPTVPVPITFSWDLQPTNIGQKVRVSGNTADRHVSALCTPPTWTSATLTNSWLNWGSPFNTAGYIREPSGHVALRGLVKSGTVALNTTSSAILRLPEGYRPAKTLVFPVITAGGVGDVRVDANGYVMAQSGDNGWFSLESIRFYISP